jgi:hypothetical protein
MIHFGVVFWCNNIGRKPVQEKMMSRIPPNIHLPTWMNPCRFVKEFAVSGFVQGVLSRLRCFRVESV